MIFEAGETLSLPSGAVLVTPGMLTLVAFEVSYSRSVDLPESIEPGVAVKESQVGRTVTVT